MNRWLFIVFMITLSIYTAFGMGNEYHEPSSPKAQEGKAVYVPINPSVNFTDEEKIQQDDQNVTGHGKAK